jgi:hypothetical protein
MQELTNDLSWSWAGVQLQGGTRTPRWKFLYDDKVEENGVMGITRMGRLRDPENFVVVNYQPSVGIMVGGVVPPWAGDRWHLQYQFLGTTPHRNETRTFDRRDRMTVESLQMDFNTFDWYRMSSIEEQTRRQGVVKVSMVMQYTYQGSYPNSDVGLYGNYYVREREYSTQISLKNWDTDGNAFKDSLVAHAG